ncbi:TPM domain-containing protein [Streptomyces sp. WMMC500]|uniref:TPM domain-containing protein n=1 Tax=Streptomyces sp. WMMC500 TaxID=3015154 RepID=UPI00248D3ADB|nr:TPM domain-containing protein [Streptomyces sp. WMMC500]WBB63323.1 TPM domain-containing protein [Streptomyces sp. WMMC500]
MRRRLLAARLTTAAALALLPAAVATTATTATRPAPVAYATDPLPLDRDGQITDRVDALRGRRGEVADALERLDREQRTQLFVAYVRDFSGFSAQDWADATAERNGLGQRDVLLAVATGDRQYAVSAATGSGLSQRDVDAVNARAIEPALRQNDWAGAAVGGADGYAAVLDGRQVPPPDVTPGPTDPGGDPGGESAEGDASATDFVVPVVAVVVVVLGVFFYRRRRPAPRKKVHLRPGGPITPPSTPLPDLDARARDLLVETDDALRTSQEELGFATAQFGEETARPFAEAVDHARAELTAAFRLRQALDDASPEDDAVRRTMLEEIVTRCTDANARLDAESDAFDRLRAMVSRAPEVLATAEAAAQRLPDRIGAAEGTLTDLAGAYAPAAVAAVAGNPAAARDRLQFATENLTHARTALGADDPATTAVHVRAAESAVDQAGTLVDAVERRERELREAAARLADAVRDIRADLADAQGVVRGTAAGESSAGLQGRVARAQTVLAEVEQERADGPYDPLAALRRVEEADAALEEELAGAREREEAERRARRLLDQALVGARSSVAAARDFVTTHRGGIGPAARTRLGEGERHLGQAEEHAGTDPAGALRHAQRADELGREAQRLAEQDVRGFDGSYGGGPFGGPYGSGYGRGYDGPFGGGRGGMGTGMLGGIILGGMLGGFGGRRGGGFGGGSGRGPGSFGGGGTRGRMGGGGRF